MAVNKELLKRTLAHIEAHPEEWKQAEWVCGTAACFAGHAVAIHDKKTLANVAADAEEYGYSVGDRARGVLGISLDERFALFDSENSLKDLRRIVSELCEFGYAL